jgi:CheY-like chemotaxis protein
VVQLRVVDLNEIIRDFQKMLRRVIGEDIELTIRLEPSLGRIRADPGQLEQILLNLAVNARDAMPRGGSLLIETANFESRESPGDHQRSLPLGSCVRLRVSDSGAGMTAEVQQHLFEPFFTTKELGKGAGLGLSTVFGIVKQCGGDIAVDSAPGRGATFTIYIPRADVDAGAPHTAKAGPAPPPGGTDTVLLLEDDAAVRNVTAAMLRRLGYTVFEGANVEQAERLSKQNKIDLLLSDVIMPKTSGVQFAMEVQRLSPNLAVLFMSGYTEDALAMQQVAGKFAILQKPFTLETLARRGRAARDQHKQGENL